MTQNSLKYGRQNCQSPNFYYESININVIQSGIYTLSSISDISLHGYLFKQHFNSYRSSERLLFDDAVGCLWNDFKITIELQSSVTYVLVVTTTNENSIGDFLILASGPNNVTFNRISKSNI